MKRLGHLFLASCFVSCVIGIAGADTPHFDVDASGNIRYMISVNADMTTGAPVNGEVAARDTMDPENARDIYGWHRPSVRAVVHSIERDYKLKALAMTSWGYAMFSAYVPESMLGPLKNDPRVTDIEPARSGGAEYSTWADRTSGSETITWGKAATGTDDSLTFSPTNTRVYIIDGGVASNADLNLEFAPIHTTSPNCSADNPTHATHVAGIIGAMSNNAEVRGVNPGTNVVNVNGCWTTQPSDVVAQAFDWVLADAESRGVYATANISVVAPGFFQGSEVWARAIRRLSNRLLVAQSAGNQRMNACSYAYDQTSAYDGIVVVGGIDETGAQAISYDNRIAYGPSQPIEAGSNWGPCVDVWAPSQRIWSTWSTSSTATQVLSGTSMAAPFMAALAARYGTLSQYTPVVREQYLRSKMVATGFNDQNTPPLAIRVPTYTQTPTFTIPTRLPIFGYSTSATYAGTSASNVSDSLYLTGTWNSGSTTGWITLDLGSSRQITTIRAVPSRSPATGTGTTNLYADNTTMPTTLIAVHNGNEGDQEAMVLGGGVTARYVRLYASRPDSWVAWREIEVYGY